MHSDARPIPHVIILQPEEALFFANADRIFAQARNTVIATDGTIHTVILSLEESPDLDSTSVEAITECITNRPPASETSAHKSV